MSLFDYNPGYLGHAMAMNQLSNAQQAMGSLNAAAQYISPKTQCAWPGCGVIGCDGMHVGPSKTVSVAHLLGHVDKKEQGETTVFKSLKSYYDKHQELIITIASAFWGVIIGLLVLRHWK